MCMQDERLARLVKVARLYYEEDRNQNEIAAMLGVSRPLVSRMLRQAREQGIVEIRIHAPEQGLGALQACARQRFGLTDLILVPDSGDDSTDNQRLAQAAAGYLTRLSGTRLGLGWGHLVGTLVSQLERQPPQTSGLEHVCPLVGNSGVSIRNYHSNENVRVIAQQLMAQPHYLYTPAFCETEQELDLILRTEHYKAVYEEWGRLDTALVNIGNYPSTPDFASVARYGNLLTEKKAVGRLIAYYYSADGAIIHSDSDYAVQIPLKLLARKKTRVVGLCSANVNARALAGALATGLINDLLVKESTLQAALGNLF